MSADPKLPSSDPTDTPITPMDRIRVRYADRLKTSKLPEPIQAAMLKLLDAAEAPAPDIISQILSLELEDR